MDRGVGEILYYPGVFPPGGQPLSLECLMAGMPGGLGSDDQVTFRDYQIALGKTSPGMRQGIVLLADSHSPMLEGVRMLLEERFEAVVMVADEPSLIQAVEKLQPVCVIVDISFPCVTSKLGRNIVSVLHERAANLKLIALSVHDERAVAERALELGAAGFVVKGRAGTELLPAIDAVLTGGTYMSPHVGLS